MPRESKQRLARARSLARLGKQSSYRRLLCVLVVVLCVNALASAQNYLTSTGTPAFSAPEPAEYGFVDASNGNLRLEIPLGAYPQRGSRKPEPIIFTYEGSIVWTIAGINPYWSSATVGGEATEGGWINAGSQPLSGQVSWVADGPTNGQGIQCAWDGTYMEPSGTQHPFPPNGAQIPGNASGCSGVTKADALATDSSGYHLYVDCSQTKVSNCIIQVYAPDGTMVFADPATQDAKGNFILVEDSNGNYISNSGGSGNYIDTTGREIAMFNNVDTSNPNSQNTPENYAITWTTIPAYTEFGQPGVAECQSSCTVRVVQSIGLPDGSSFSFKYDCDSTKGNSACGSPGGQSAYYAMLTSMTMPTGGTVTYTWDLVTDPYGNKHLWLASRTSASGTWTYADKTLSTCSPTQVGCQQQVTATNPNGDYTVYTFTLDNGDWPVEIQRYNGAATLMSTVNTTWDFSHSCPWYQCSGHVYVTRSVEKVTYPVPGGASITKQTTYTYDSPQNGNLIAVKEWRFLSGTNPTFGSVPDRATYIAYYPNSGTNIINKPSTTTLCNNQQGSDPDCTGGGLKVAQTKVTYDSYGQNGLVGVSGMANHDDTNFGTANLVRGNPTQIQQWVSGTTNYLTTSRTYDATGQVLSSTDPAGNTTTYSYADNYFIDNYPAQSYMPPVPTNAYLTGIQLPKVGGVTMKLSMGYYYGSGKLSFSSDANSQSSYFHFVNPATSVNDPFDRKTETILPFGWSLTNYTSQTQTDIYSSVNDTAASAGCSSCRHNELNFDSWGRKVTETLYLPGGSADSLCTTYDGNSRIYQVSHPGCSVYETFAYDALERKTSVTHPDSQSVLTAFGPNVSVIGGVSTQQLLPATYGYGYPVMLMDESGKQRQEWIDGFGNVIEVDEPSGTTGGKAPSATVTVSGSEGSKTVCVPPNNPELCHTTYDTGTISLTVSGYTATASWSEGSTSASLAAALSGQFTGGQSPITATVSGSTITMTGLVPGTYTLPFSTSVNGTNKDFSFSPTSGNLSGGSGGFGASPNATGYQYDAAGRLASVAQGVQSRTFVYDGLGRATSITTPEAETDLLAYDSDTTCPSPNSFPGNLVKKLDARGVRTCYQYDALNRLTGKNYSNGQASISYQYDQGGAAAYALGRLTTMTDQSGSEVYTYDQGGRVTQLKKTIGTTAYTIGYQYYTDGQVKQITYPSGRVVQQGIDSIGRLSSIADTLNSVNTTRASNYGYNLAQQVTGFSYGNGVVAAFTYDPNRQYLTNLSYTSGTQTLFNLTYYYQNSTNCPAGTTGSDGVIDCISDGVDSGRTAAYTYDPLGRIASAVTNGSTNYPKWGLSWGYDRYGNRLNQTVTAGSGYSSTLSFANPGGAQTNQPGGMCFDASGNMLAESACPPTAPPTYTYDAEDHLMTYTGTSATAGSIYDDHGHRVEKCLPNCTSPTSTTVYIFLAGKDIAEYSNGAPPASPSAEYIYSDGMLISTLTSTSTTYHHSDHLSVRVSTGTNGAVVGQQGHYPYGEVWYTANTTTKFIFTGYERDSESGTQNGNDYALGRYYRVAFGRFCSADPIPGDPGDPQTWNRYVYVRDNPVNLTDPSGLSWLSSFFQELINLINGVLSIGQSSGTPPFVTSSTSDNPWTELDNVLTTPGQLPAGGVIENWSPDAHDQMIWNALHPCGVSNHDIWEIQKGSRSIDQRFHDPAHAYMHSMSDGTVGQSAADALAERDDFTYFSLLGAQADYANGNEDAAMTTFGEAMHPVMDSTSPAHTDSQGNPIPWCGLGGCGSFPGTDMSNVLGHSASTPFGDFPGGETVTRLNHLPEIQDKMNSLMRAAYQTMTGLTLNCDGN
jgi:RHS repeat-associated protein